MFILYNIYLAFYLLITIRIPLLNFKTKGEELVKNKFSRPDTKKKSYNIKRLSSQLCVLA